MAEKLEGRNGTAILTTHFMERLRQNRGRYHTGLRIPYEKIMKQARRYPNRKCRALLNDQYWIHFKYEPHQEAVVFLSLLPKWFILPEPSNWVALI